MGVGALTPTEPPMIRLSPFETEPYHVRELTGSLEKSQEDHHLAKMAEAINEWLTPEEISSEVQRLKDWGKVTRHSVAIHLYKVAEKVKEFHRVPGVLDHIESKDCAAAWLAILVDLILEHDTLNHEPRWAEWATRGVKRGTIRTPQELRDAVEAAISSEAWGPTDIERVRRFLGSSPYEQWRVFEDGHFWARLQLESYYFSMMAGFSHALENVPGLARGCYRKAVKKWIKRTWPEEGAK